MQREGNLLVYCHKFSKQNRKGTPSNDVFHQKEQVRSIWKKKNLFRWIIFELFSRPKEGNSADVI